MLWIKTLFLSLQRFTTPRTFATLAFLAGHTPALATLVAPETDAVPPWNDTFLSTQWTHFPAGQTSLQDGVSEIYPVEVGLNPAASIEWKPYDHVFQRDVVIASIDSGVEKSQDDIREVLLPGRSFVFVEEALNQDYEDDNNHGTHTLSIMGAQWGNRVGMAGLSNRFRFLPLKVVENPDPGDKRLAEAARHNFVDRVAMALDYAIAQKVDAINMSFGWPRSLHTPRIAAALRRALDADIILVAASGNDGQESQIFPCAFPGVVCVGAFNLDGTRSPFSNYGSHVDIYAPGNEILGAIPAHLDSQFFGIRGYDLKSATSQAAPFVTGALAMMRGMHPKKTRKALVARLLGNANILPEGQLGLSIRGAMEGTKPSLDSRPIFKTLETLDVPLSATTFEVAIPWTRRPTSKPVLSLKTPGYSLRGTSWQSRPKNNLGGEATAAWVATIQAAGPDISSHLQLELRVNGRTYAHGVSVNRPVQKSPPALIARQDLPNSPNVDLIQILGVSNLVADHYVGFWTLDKTSEEGPGLRLQLWNAPQPMHRFAKFDIKLPTFSGLLQSFGVVRVDWAGQGQPGYILAAAQEKDNDLGASLHFLYFDENWSLVHDFSFVPDPIYPEVTKTEDYHFLPTEFAGGRILVPVFWSVVSARARTSLSQADVNPFPLEFEDERRMARVYSFEPGVVDGQKTLTGRTLTHKRFAGAIRRKNKLSSAFQVRWLGLSPQTPGSYWDEPLELVFSTGKHSVTRKWRMSIDDPITFANSVVHSPPEAFWGLTDFKEIPGTGPYDFGEQLVDGDDLRANPVQSAWSLENERPQWHPENHIIMDRYNGRRVTWFREGPTRVADIKITPNGKGMAGLLKTFLQPSDETSAVTLFETTRSLRWQGSWNGRAVDVSQPILKSTIVPNVVFTQQHSPTIVGEERWPGVVIDNSFWFDRTLRIHSPARPGKAGTTRSNTFSVPKGCLRKNNLLKTNGAHAVPLLCKNSDQGVRVYFLTPQ